MKNSFLYLVAATVATLVLGDESTQTTFLRANPKGKSTKKGSKTMLAASCNRAYPGSTPITPPGYKGECKCAVDPTDVESKEAWECPEGFTLEFDEAANDEKTREGMPQYHCIKREAVTEWVTKSEPLLCPTGWTLDKETSKCTYKDPDCVEKCEKPLDTDSGLVDPATGKCVCDCELELECIGNDDIKYNPSTGACEWKVPDPKVKVEIRHPICIYKDMKRVVLDDDIEASTVVVADDGEPLPIRRLPGGPFVYDVGVTCPRIFRIPRAFVSCGPRSPAGVFKGLQSLLKLEDQRNAGIVELSRDTTAALNTWSECTTKCVTLYAKATECAKSTKYPCKVTAATPGIKGYNPYSKKKIIKSHQDLLESKFNFGYKIGENSCSCQVNGGFQYCNQEKYGQADANLMGKILFTSSAMPPVKLMDKFDSLAQTITDGLEVNPLRWNAPCQGGIKSRNKKDGTCKPEYEGKVDWIESIRVSREELVQEAVEFPFAVNCRDIATNVFMKGQSFLQCKQACGKSKWDEDHWPEYHCDCHKNSVGGACFSKKKKKKKAKGGKNNAPRL